MSRTIQPPHRAMILCAGLGERLRPLSDELPKPLVPVGDNSALAHIATALRRAGIHSAVANTHWLSDKIEAISDTLDVELTLVHEPVIRGVAGGIAGAGALLQAPLISWNGDILIDTPPIDELLASVAASGGICLAVAPTAGPGTVGLDARSQLVRVRGQSFGVEVRQADYVGLVALGATALQELPEFGCLIGDYCLPRLRSGAPVHTLLMQSAWQEVGSLDSYLKANAHWLSHHANHGEGSYVHPSASVSAGVQLRSSVVGANARVDGVGSVAGSVIWPTAQATAPLANSVITPRSRARL